MPVESFDPNNINPPTTDQPIPFLAANDEIGALALSQEAGAVNSAANSANSTLTQSAPVEGEPPHSTAGQGEGMGGVGQAPSPTPPSFEQQFAQEWQQGQGQGQQGQGQQGQGQQQVPIQQQQGQEDESLSIEDFGKRLREFAAGAAGAETQQGTETGANQGFSSQQSPAAPGYPQQTYYQPQPQPQPQYQPQYQPQPAPQVNPYDAYQQQQWAAGQQFQPQPVGPFSPYSNPNLDPDIQLALQSQIAPLQNQIAQTNAIIEQQQQFLIQQEQQRQAEFARQAQLGTRRGLDEFRNQYNVSDQDLNELIQSASPIADALYAQTGDIAVATKSAMEQAFWANPRLRQAMVDMRVAYENSVIQENLSRQNRAGALAPGGGGAPQQGMQGPTPQQIQQMSQQQREAAMIQDLEQYFSQG